MDGESGDSTEEDALLGTGKGESETGTKLTDRHMEQACT